MRVSEEVFCVSNINSETFRILSDWVIEVKKEEQMKSNVENILKMQKQILSLLEQKSMAAENPFASLVESKPSVLASSSMSVDSSSSLLPSSSSFPFFPPPAPVMPSSDYSQPSFNNKNYFSR